MSETITVFYTGGVFLFLYLIDFLIDQSVLKILTDQTGVVVESLKQRVSFLSESIS